MKVAFDFITDETPLFIAVGELLEKEGYEVTGLTLGKRWKTLWENRFRTAPISTISKDEKDVDYPPGLTNKLDQIEQEYGQFKPSSFLHADRFLCEFNRQHQIAILINTFRCVERFFENEKPDIYFCTPIAYLFNLVTHAVCKRLGIPHISIYTTRGEVPRFTYTTGVSFKWDQVCDIYHKLMGGVSYGIDKKKIEAAEEKLKCFRSSPHRPYYMKTARINYKFHVIFLKEFITRLKYYYAEGWGRDRSDYMTQTPFWYAVRDSKRLLRAAIFSRFKNKIFDPAKQSVPYYLFPLNVQPESATLIYSEWYVDLLSTIQNISRCLPLGTYLYVKEHTSAFGRRELKFYQMLKKLHNVRILGPWNNTDLLIVNSIGVIVLSSTMGWEALMHGKPTYVLGKLFCNYISPVINIDGYDNLRKRLYEDYQIKKYQPLISDDSIVAFIASIQAASFPGLFAPAKLDIRNTVLSPENVCQVADGLKQIIAYEYKEKVIEEMKR